MPWMTDEPRCDRADVRAGRSRVRCSTSAGSTRTILVQAACTDGDTDAMFEQADAQRVDRRRHRLGRPRSPDRARARLDELARRPKLRGIRHLIHEEADPHWILRDDVLESLALLEDTRLVLELPCVFPRHLGDVPELAQRFPGLTIVIDHLGKPPLGTERMGDWATLRRERGRRTRTCPPRSPV